MCSMLMLSIYLFVKEKVEMNYKKTEPFWYLRIKILQFPRLYPAGAKSPVDLIFP